MCFKEYLQEVNSIQFNNLLFQSIQNTLKNKNNADVNQPNQAWQYSYHTFFYFCKKWKQAKKYILTSTWAAQHPFAGRNIQHTST